MKKIIIFIIISFTTSFVTAQIKRNIDGIVLNKSTKTEVKTHLSQKHIFSDEIEDGHSIVGYGDLSLGGIVWDGVKYDFCDNTVYQVCYVKYYNRRSKGHQQLNNTYLNLRKTLLNKYTKHKTPSAASIPDKLFINGKETTLELKKVLDGENGRYILSLKYTDVELNKKVKKKNYDDL